MLLGLTFCPIQCIGQNVCFIFKVTYQAKYIPSLIELTTGEPPLGHLKDS